MSLRMRTAAAALALACSLPACNGSSSREPGTPPPAPGTQNPCATVALEEEGYVPPIDARAPDAAARKRQRIDGTPRWRVLDALWIHRAHGRSVPAAAARDVQHLDAGDIAIVQDEGDIVLPANPYDLRSLGLRFTRNGAGGYDVARTDGTFRQTLGTRLTLEDDDSERADVPFSFAFYQQAHTTAFVNSDGNVTFEEEDRASTERNVARLLTGPPRVAPFLADLDPSAGGRVYVHAAPDQYTVTWCDVRGFDSTRTARVQATLLPSGVVEFKFGDTTSLEDAIVGLSPGRTGEFTAVNLSNADSFVAGGGAVGERFASQQQLDTVALVKKFYRDHPDDYDQLVIWTDQNLVRDAFAYETTVANEIRGIGLEVFDLSRDFGSAGRLRSYAVMDTITKYPDDPMQKFLGENNTMSVLAQEVGHRWLVFMDFRDHRGERSDIWLGRDGVHWSFFFNSTGSVMEGNQIADLGGGSFRTGTAVERYNLFDLYAMGVVRESEVPPSFYVEGPQNVQPARDRDDAPQPGVTFNGTRRDVLIQDVIAIHGPRDPAEAPSRRHRQAFILMVSAGRQLNAAHVSKLDTFRRTWEAMFSVYTDGRMSAETVLR